MRSPGRDFGAGLSRVRRVLLGQYTGGYEAPPSHDVLVGGIDGECDVARVCRVCRMAGVDNTAVKACLPVSS